jgi:hypothetical protein
MPGRYTRSMALRRLDHVSVVVDDVAGASISLPREAPRAIVALAEEL